MEISRNHPTGSGVVGGKGNAVVVRSGSLRYGTASVNGFPTMAVNRSGGGSGVVCRPVAGVAGSASAPENCRVGEAATAASTTLCSRCSVWGTFEYPEQGQAQNAQRPTWGSAHRKRPKL